MAIEPSTSTESRSVPNPAALLHANLIRKAALDYLADGYSVIPVVGKEPALIVWQRWQTDRPDAALVEAWWTKSRHPDLTVTAKKHLANGGVLGVAIICGPISGVFVLDNDTPEGAAFIASNGGLPDVACAITSDTGGFAKRHYYLGLPFGIDVANDVRGHLPGCDIRGQGGYVVAPPSPHPRGGQYLWASGHAPTRQEIPTPPAWLEKLLQAPAPRKTSPAVPTIPIDASPAAHNGKRHGRLSRATRDFIRDGASEGERNNRLFKAAADLAGCRYDVDEALLCLVPPAVRSGLSEREARQAIQSAFGEPRTPARPDANEGPPEIVPPAPAVDPRHEQQKDWGHALLLWTLTPDALRWANHRPSWMEFDGAAWQPVPETRAIALASDALRIHYAGELAATREKDEIAALGKAITETCLASKMSAALRFYAGRRPVLVLRADEWDAQAWLLNVTNGTLDLRNHALRPHTAGDLITRLAPTTHDPDAGAPRWDAHLRRFLPMADVRRQVQRDLGRALVGTTLEETLSIWYGTGANGKTTTSRVLAAVLGNYVTKTAPDLLVERKHEQHPTAVADLIGTRLAFAVEAGEHARLAETLIKDLTGGDRIKTRYMRGDFFEAERTFDLILVANHQPAIHSTDEGIWRRVRLIPWEYQIPEAERRPQDEIVAALTDEAPGILNWLLDGLDDWQADHHWMAQQVRATTDTYRADQDILAEFLDERCEMGPRYQCGVGELYENYVEWSGKSTPLGKQMFGRRLRDRGFTQTHTSHKQPREWVGLRIGGTGLAF